jgi:hypothetical protein
MMGFVHDKILIFRYDPVPGRNISQEQCVVNDYDMRFLCILPCKKIGTGFAAIPGTILWCAIFALGA